MTVNPTEHKEPGDLAPAFGKEFTVKAKVRFSDLSLGLKLILAALLAGVGVILSTADTGSFFESDIIGTRIMIISGVMAVAAFYLAYRSAQRTKKREEIRSQADKLLSSLLNVKSRISGQ